MAQASSIQREPSMEEILASIRRIIEDNDAGNTAVPEVGDDTPTDQSFSEVDSFRAELKPVSETSAESAIEEPERESSSTPHGFWGSATESDRPMGEARVDDDVLMEPLDGTEAQSQRNFASSASVNGKGSDRQSAETEDSLAAAVADNAKTQFENDLRPAIVSETSGRQAAAAFQELNEALEANRRKSLDQMAEDMLRPMLQEWLDNNLPRLVEKLVREEIERIARGT